MTIHEMALNAAEAYRKKIYGDLDALSVRINEVTYGRGYKLGALDALKEIETRIEMGKHASLQTADTILGAVKMVIKELKGE